MKSSDIASTLIALKSARSTFNDNQCSSNVMVPTGSEHQNSLAPSTTASDLTAGVLDSYRGRDSDLSIILPGIKRLGTSIAAADKAYVLPDHSSSEQNPESGQTFGAPFDVPIVGPAMAAYLLSPWVADLLKGAKPKDKKVVEEVDAGQQDALKAE